MDKLKMHSPNFTDENIAKLAELFPSCVTESMNSDGELTRAIDFDQLKQELSNNIVEGPQERYQLNWPGKREALLTANSPIAKTLRPCREESVDFDTTENLFIEGDNLDVLKLLQETYLGKVKMIYIDPPYNTGNDFIYVDDFSNSTEEYMLDSRQKDEEGNRLVINTDSNGRFHSDWLSMIYSRLRLARNLLEPEGLIAIQIDDAEITNLQKIMNEIFGEENLVNLIAVKMSHLSGVKMSHANSKLPKLKEFILIYAKDKEKTKINPIFVSSTWRESLDRYTQYINYFNDDIKNWAAIPIKEAVKKENIDFSNSDEREAFLINNAQRIFRTARNKSIKYTGIKGVFIKIKTKTGLDKFVYNDEEVLFASDKLKLIDGELKPVNPVGDMWLDIGINNLHNEGGVVFKNGKKPLKLIERLLDLILVEDNHIVMDFFAGSGTSAHALINYNIKNNKSCKFVLVQIPEKISQEHNIDDNKFTDLTQIGKERIRKLSSEKSRNLNLATSDVGFRVLKVDDSNMSDVYYSPDSLNQADLSLFSDNIKDDRSSEDLLFQVLLDWGVDLTLPINKETIAGREVFFVDGNALAACFDKEGQVDEEFCKELAARKILRVVFRDAGFKDDSVKINVEQIFKLLSPHSDLKTI